MGRRIIKSPGGLNPYDYYYTTNHQLLEENHKRGRDSFLELRICFDPFVFHTKKSTKDHEKQHVEQVWSEIEPRVRAVQGPGETACKAKAVARSEVKGCVDQINYQAQLAVDTGIVVSIVEYNRQVNTYGYPDAPMEVEARRASCSTAGKVPGF